MKNRMVLNTEVIKEWKASQGVKLSFFSRKLGCSDSYFQKLLSGDRVAGPAQVKILAKILGVKVQDLLLPENKKSA